MSPFRDLRRYHSLLIGAESSVLGGNNHRAPAAIDLRVVLFACCCSFRHILRFSSVGMIDLRSGRSTGGIDDHGPSFHRHGFSNGRDDRSDAPPTAPL